ncbi:sterile alpha motif domain-containing protein 15-like [Branchiostoma lanceolatum]|uniref:SAMD15 protein n=1 Tax=Branchiostoma lanceolatum TaxID=7740 RepID=A0A8J9ZWW6_BRALA|nr:SAMD15 [Branchiostoma lanceolatum]
MAAAARERDREIEMAVPNCLHWSCEDVADWIEQLGFPQYRECFTTNLINGRKLIQADCSSLPRLGITDFEHMKLIARSVRELLGIEEPRWDRSISLHPREPMGMFLERKSNTGRKADNLTYAGFLKGK